MKYKNYILVLLLTIFIGCNITYADSNKCYYSSIDNQVLLSYDTNSARFTIEKRGNIDTASTGTKEPLKNNGKDKKDGKTKITVSSIDSGCPQYVVYRHNSTFLGSDDVWGFNDSTTANAFSNESNDINKMSSWVLGTTNESSFENALSDNQEDTPDVSCEGIFGDPNDSNSLRYLINEILTYPRIIVPILIIGLGFLDLGKAVIASKEDEMKKAQSTFIKRLIIGVAVFLVPAIVNLIMYLADILWNGMYTIC